MSGRRKRPTRQNKKYTQPKLRQCVKIAYLIEKKAPYLLDLDDALCGVQRIFACTKGVAQEAITLVELRRDASA